MLFTTVYLATATAKLRRRHTPGPALRDHHDHQHEDGHGHSHSTLDTELTTHRAAIRAIWISVAGLGLTAAFQLAIVAINGSAGPFADALHNVGDVAGTAAL